jgi:hypothetical protein
MAADPSEDETVKPDELESKVEAGDAEDSAVDSGQRDA